MFTTLQAANAGAQKIVPRAASITTSGFTLVIYVADLSTTSTITAASNPIAWQAIQMTPTASAG